MNNNWGNNQQTINEIMKVRKPQTTFSTQSDDHKNETKTNKNRISKKSC